MLRKACYLFPGDGREDLIFAIVAFFWVVAVTTVLKFADALFLLHIGSEHLPTLYAISAASMILIAALLIYGFHTFAPHKVFIASLTLSALFYLSIFFMFSLETKNSWVWYLFRVFGSINFALIGTSFWTFVDQYYHLQNAKRLFSLFNSMIFLGVSATGLIMLSGWFEFKTLALMIALFLMVAIALIGYIHSQFRPIHDDTEVEEARLSYAALFKGIAGSRFTLLLMTSNLLIYLLMATTEFNYYSTFDRVFDTGKVIVGDEADATLTQFLGKALTTVSLTNLLFGLFFYSRLLRRFGIGFLLPITPLIALFAYGAWQLEDTVWIALIGYFVVEGTNYVIDDSNFNHLLNAVPTRFKPKIRVTIESFFEPIGTLLAAILLSLNIIAPKILGLTLSVALLIMAVALRRQYLAAIWHNLAQNAIHFSRKIGAWFQVSDLKGNLDIRFAIDCFANTEDRETLLWMLKEIESKSTEDKIYFIQALGASSFSSDPLALELVQRWLLHAERGGLLEELYLFLAEKGLLDPDGLKGELDSGNLKLKGAAIMTLLRAPGDGASSHKTLAFEKVEAWLKSGAPEKIKMGLKILALDPSPQNVDIALSYSTHSENGVQREAAKALFKMASPNIAERLSSLLLDVHDSEAREYLLKTLSLVGLSENAERLVKAAAHFRPSERRLAETTLAGISLKNVPLLFTFLKDRSLPDRSRLTAGKALGKIALLQLQTELEAILEPEIKRAIFFWQHAKKTSAHPEFSLLTDTLKADYDSILDFIIQLLGVAGEIEDTELLSRMLKSPFPKLRSQAIETIERSCEPKIFRELQPLLENTLPDAPEIPLRDLLKILQTSSSIANKIVAFTLMKQLNFEDWRSELKRERDKGEEVFKHFAYELLET